MDQYCYDAAGNRTGPTPCPASQYAYDAENRIKTAGGATYTYDGDGKRVKKDSGKLYWTGTGSDPLAESDLSGTINEEYVFFNGKRIARLDLPSGTVHYYFADHLGSASVVTNADGTTIQDESDYFPFGGERILTNSDPNQYKFTGKERDAETGLDYFGARYYASNMGRWASPDWSATPQPVPYSHLENPQTLNLYVYVKGNPLFSPDLDGHQGADDSRKGCSAEHSSCEDGPTNPLNNSRLGRAANFLVGGDDIALAAYNMRNSETTEGKVESGVALVLAVAINVVPGGSQEAKATEKAGVWVYRVVKDGKVIYIGISGAKSIARRIAVQSARFGVSPETVQRIIKMGTRLDARAVEQVLIESHGLQNLENKINSIARSSSIYDSAKQLGQEILETLRYSPLP